MCLSRTHSGFFTKTVLLQWLSQLSIKGQVAKQKEEEGPQCYVFTLPFVPTRVCLFLRVCCRYTAESLQVSVRLCVFQTCVSINECVCISSVGDRGERSPVSAGKSRGAELNSQISRKSSWFLCFHSRNLREVRQGSSST